MVKVLINNILMILPNANIRIDIQIEIITPH